jgi:nitroreductase
MDLEAAIFGRRAVREFTAEPVPEDVLRRLIDAAIQAPSAINQQPWSFTVVRDQPLLDRISRAAKAHMLSTLSAGAAPHHFKELLSNADFQIFYHASALILISAVDAGTWAVEDCSLAAENLMLAACAAGLGTCWIGFAQNWLGTSDGKASLGLPATHLPVAPIIVGHPKTPAPPVARKAPEIRWVG